MWVEFLWHLCWFKNHLLGYITVDIYMPSLMTLLHKLEDTPLPTPKIVLIVRSSFLISVSFVGDQEMAASVGLELDMMLGSSLNNFQPNRFQDSTEDNKISSQKLENQIWLVR